MPSGGITRPDAASGRPNRPQGLTTSTTAIRAKTSTSVTFGKIRMPKAWSWPMISAATKAPGTEPIPPITVTTKASVMTERSIWALAGMRGIWSAPPNPARLAPRNSVRVKSGPG